MTPPLSLATSTFADVFGRAPDFVARAPGRVNLLGEHIDYNDGFVLPAAIHRAAFVAVGGRADALVNVQAPDISSETSFRLDQVDDKLDTAGQPLRRWAWYPAGVAWALRERGLDVRGLDAVLSSNVPRGSGLSSSAAVEVAFAAAWQRLGGWELAPMDLALTCQRAENHYVGVNSGIMDQFASRCGQAGHALLLDCRSLDWEPVPVPENVAIVVADTTKRRELGTSEYNTRREQCEAAVAALSAVLPGLQSLRDVSVEDLERYAHRLDPVVAKRARHVVHEIARTVAGAEALKAGRVADFGQLMNEGHASLRDLYEVSIRELDVMVAAAQRLPGCYGARLTGAGFGGCTVNLVAAEAAEDFERELARAYEAATGLRPEIYVSRAAAGAGIV